MPSNDKLTQRVQNRKKGKRVLLYTIAIAVVMIIISIILFSTLESPNNTKFGKPIMIAGFGIGIGIILGMIYKKIACQEVKYAAPVENIIYRVKEKLSP